MSPRDSSHRWTPADDFAKARVVHKDTPVEKALENCLRLADESGVGNDIAVSTLQGRFLTIQCKLLGVKRVLELGTLGGYSAICMASAGPEVHVTTIDIDPKATACGQKAAKEAGLSDRIECLHGVGLDVLPKIREEVDGGKRPKFDFVFIDADKINNIHYMNAAIPMCEPGTCIIVDNVGRRGNIGLTVEEMRATGMNEGRIENVVGSMIAIEEAGKDPRLECTVIQTVGEKGYDGFMMCMLA